MQFLNTLFRLLPSPFATNATVILKILAEAYEISENFQIQLRYIGILKLHSEIRNCNLVGLSWDIESDRACKKFGKEMYELSLFTVNRATLYFLFIRLQLLRGNGLTLIP